jgi:hypothetical protein
VPLLLASTRAASARRCAPLCASSGGGFAGVPRRAAAACAWVIARWQGPHLERSAQSASTPGIMWWTSVASAPQSQRYPSRVRMRARVASHPFGIARPGAPLAQRSGRGCCAQRAPSTAAKGHRGNVQGVGARVGISGSGHAAPSWRDGRCRVGRWRVGGLRVACSCSCAWPSSLPAWGWRVVLRRARSPRCRTACAAGPRSRSGTSWCGAGTSGRARRGRGAGRSDSSGACPGRVRCRAGRRSSRCASSR